MNFYFISNTKHLWLICSYVYMRFHLQGQLALQSHGQGPVLLKCGESATSHSAAIGSTSLKQMLSNWWLKAISVVSPVHQHWRYLSLALSCQNGSCDATDWTSCGNHITSIRRTPGLSKHQNRNMLNWSIWSTHKTHHATRTSEELIAECHAEINHQPFRPLASLSLICLL